MTYLNQCTHLGTIHDVTPSSAQGCAECLALGNHNWVRLRMCLSCGNVGCCESSPYQHAQGHFERTSHPIIRSFQPGETWRWCFVDETLV